MPPPGLDEDYARRLQQQYDLELRVENSGRMGSPPHGTSNRPPPVAPHVSSAGSRNSGGRESRGVRTPPRSSGSPGFVASTILDEEYARRVQQQMRDEEMAMRMQREEQERAIAMANNRRHEPGVVVRGHAVPVRPSGHEVVVTQRRRRSCCARCCAACCALGSKVISTLLCVASVAITAALVFGLMGGGDVPIPGVPDIPDLGDVFMTDPWDAGGSEGATAAWRTRKKEGLELVIVNSLEEGWHEFFRESVDDWDNGNPDALSLTTVMGEPEFECEPISGRMKVCNGNYGGTGWKGVNEVLLQNDWITASVAKMNEYYLAGSTKEEKQYTMCHEMGHGFGLGHTDENFFNDDLGTCMDYTNKPANNQRPNSGNYETLLDLYGYVSAEDRKVAQQLMDSSTTVKQELQDNSEVGDLREKDKKHEGKEGKDGGGTRRNILQRDYQALLEKQLQFPRYTSFADSLSTEGHSRRWRMLGMTNSGLGEVHEMDLGDGFKVVAHVLLHVDEDEKEKERRI